MTTPVVISSEVISWAAGATPAAQNITIPADATAVYVMWGGYNSSSLAGTFVLNSVSAEKTELSGSGGSFYARTGASAWRTSLTGTGSQSLAVTWSASPSETPQCAVIYVKDVDVSGGSNSLWRSAASCGSGEAAASTATIATVADDLLLLHNGWYGATTPTLYSGYTSVATRADSSRASRWEYKTETDSSETVTSSGANPYWDLVVLLALRGVASADTTSQSLTGAQSTGGVGAVSGAIAQSVSGVQASGQVGTLTASGSGTASANLTGVESSGGTGALSVSASGSITLSGANASGVVGALTASGSGTASANLTGVESSGGAGTVATALTASLSGVQATSAAGSLTASTGQIASPSGVQATGGIGALGMTLSASLTISGVSAASGIGTLSASGTGAASATLTGVQATSGIGSLTTTLAASFTLSGVQSTGEVGVVSVTQSASQILSGVAATGNAGSLLFFSPLPSEDYIIKVSAANRVLFVSYMPRTYSLPFISRTLH